ncbi:hypothetical protein D3C87_1575120 [compost metagenome]
MGITPLLLRHGVEVAALQRVVDQPRRRDKPAAPHLTVDHTLRLQLTERFLQRNTGGGKLFAQSTFRRQFAVGAELPHGDPGVQRLADGRHGCRYFTHATDAPF